MAFGFGEGGSPLATLLRKCLNLAKEISILGEAPGPGEDPPSLKDGEDGLVRSGAVERYVRALAREKPRSNAHELSA
eukprot:518144-Alexandrium_andersonii.AAC.1